MKSEPSLIKNIMTDIFKPIKDILENKYIKALIILDLILSITIGVIYLICYAPYVMSFIFTIMLLLVIYTIILDFLN